MITALIFAGGTGQRMNSASKPKQFLELHGKPIIIYTIEHFEWHPEIDNIIVVCLESWIKELKRFLKLYDIRKVSKIIAGGISGDKSIYNGLKAMRGTHASDDIVLIHDGVRPLINENLISENIATAKRCGNAITCEATFESIIQSSNGNEIDNIPKRSEMFVAKAPQTFRYGDIWDLYQQAENDGHTPLDSAHLCSLYGVKLHIVRSTPNNIKITAPQDYYIFRALHEAMENRQILGV
ncbi:IspD/TarI family cytidylyltransferase [Paenibacillus sp. y28]|uniref:IspD/TarI family cytidylyltransferase n=1 Tax=Paenibacillus sp. y28 TaxID=3129110 RepID=UPI00301B10DC